MGGGPGPLGPPPPGHAPVGNGKNFVREGGGGPGLWKNVSIHVPKNSNLQEKRHFQQPREVSAIMKKPQPL